MTRDLSRRRLLASAGVALSAGAASVVGASDDAPAVSSAQSSGPPALRWNRTYAARAYSTAASLVETDDGDYVAFGTTRREQLGVGGAWLFGIDGTTGEGQWRQVVDADEETVYRAFAPAEEGYVLAGLVSDPGVVELRAVTTDGEVLWRNRYAPDSDSAARTLLPSAVVSVDDGFVVAGARDGRTEEEVVTDAVAFKVDETGAEQWRHVFLEDVRSEVVSLSSVGDGEFVAAGPAVEPSGSGGGSTVVEGALFRFDASGEVAWSQRYTAGGPESPNPVNRLLDHVETDDGYLAVGVTGDTTSAAAWVVPTDDSGAPQSPKTFGENTSLRLLGVTADEDTYYAVGTGRGSGGSVAYLGALDAAGEELWRETTGRKDTNQFSDVLATSDGGIAVAGTTVAADSGGDTPGEAWLAKLGGEEAPSVTVSQGSTATATATTMETATTAPTESPTETATATPAPTEAVTGEPAATTAATAAEGNTQAATSSADGPGFGVGSAVAGLVGGALLRRVRDEE